MGRDPKAAYFGAIAGTWDDGVDLVALGRKLAEGLEEIGVGGDETVLDIGCGTGNLTRALLARLSPRGRAIAVDFSFPMVAAARRKVADGRVAWQVADARSLPLADRSVDRAICFSVWPHFDDPRAVARELARVLRLRGKLHVWHLASRKAIEEIHASAGEAIRGDKLAPAAETARILREEGFAPYAIVDDDERYLVSAVKLAR